MSPTPITWWPLLEGSPVESHQHDAERCCLFFSPFPFLSGLSPADVRIDMTSANKMAVGLFGIVPSCAASAVALEQSVKEWQRH